MKTRHILLCLALSLLGIGLEAQNDLPQVFSPNASELGKYGKIPVSYFNGLPNISIPLTELKAKGYTLPIYLTYHAGGNKPIQHPGWVGLGWTLHAGGSINRIVHGLKDEIDENELWGIYRDSSLDPPDYLNHASSFQAPSFDSAVLDSALYYPSYDLNPDEFQVNFQGLNSSFYLTGENSAKIESADAVDYSVSVQIEPSTVVDVYENERQFLANQYTYISTIWITTGDGIVFQFGGTDDSIEFNYEVDPSSTNVKRLKRDPITWNITSILFPTGEEITFEYVKAGLPIVTLDRHYYESCLYDPRDPDNLQGYIVNTQMELGEKQNINYVLLSPSYLQRIRTKMTGEEVTFSISPAIEKEDVVDTETFHEKIDLPLDRFPWEKSLAENKYQKLDRIESPHDTISLGYTSSDQDRLKLLSLSFNAGPVKRYGMIYNSKSLPDYHSRHLDSWGYYSQSSIIDGDGPYYQVDEDAMKAEILECLQYPTGGETHFEYEAHRYGRIARQYPFELESSQGMAGGLRIKRIKDISDGKETIREYRYLDETGGSSGILADKPRFEADGTMTLGMAGYHDWAAPLVYVNIDSITWAAPYHLAGERLLNQLPLTQGCHVSYSRVEEVLPEAGKTVFHYSNHDDTPDEPYDLGYSNYEDCGLYNSFSSHSLARGLLLRKEMYAQGSISPKQVEEMEYARDTTDYVRGIDQIVQCREILRRVALIRYYTYFPGLVNRTVTLYPDGGGLPYTDTTKFTYDTHRRLTKMIRVVGETTERDTLTYTGNFSNGDYVGMVAHSMISYPVEHVRSRKEGAQPEKIVSANLTTWKRWGDVFVPSEQYRANVGSGLTRSFRYYNGNRKDFSYDLGPELKYSAYDTLGNILLTEDHAKYPTTYVWTPDGCHPAAVFPGAKEEYTKYMAGDVSRTATYQLDPEEDFFLQFESVSSFTLKIWLTCPNNQCWDLSPVVDGTSYRVVCVNDPQAPNPWPTHASSYPSPLSIPLGPGIHIIRIRSGNHFYAANSPDPIMFSVELNYKEKQVTEQLVPGHTVVFEDFEDEPGELPPEGYHSAKGHQGTWTHSLDASGGPYLVDYRVYRDGKWHYVRQKAPGASVTINEGISPIDHIRIYPMDCLPESYTWYSDGLLRSHTDSRGVTESYRYDGLGRLVGINDNDEKKVEEYEYNYINR